MSAVDLLCDARQACALDSLNRGRCRPWLYPCGARVSPLRVPPTASGDPAGAANPVPPRAPPHGPSPGRAVPGGRESPRAVPVGQRAALGLAQVAELRGALQIASSGKMEGEKPPVFVGSLSYSAPVWLFW